MAVIRCSPNTQIDSPPVIFYYIILLGEFVEKKENCLIEQENERDESSVGN